MLSQLNASQSGGSRGKSGKMSLKLCQLTCAKEDRSAERAKEYPGNRDSAKKVATFDGPAASIVGTKLLPGPTPVVALPLKWICLLYILASQPFLLHSFTPPLLYSSTAKLFSLQHALALAPSTPPAQVT